MKDRITARYEDKIREHANPGKIFRYFATVSIDGTVHMRPQDFIRSISPGELQPEGLGLDEFDSYKSTDEPMLGMADYRTPLLQYNDDGTLKETLTLISYAEYRFLCTLLTAPENYLRVAFRLMDRDGSDAIELDEFMAMTAVLGSKTRQRKLTANASMWDERGVLEHSHLLKQLFGPAGKGTINFDQFRRFAEDLQRRVLHINFLHTQSHRHGPGHDKISEISFAKMLLKHAQIPREMRAAYYKRINAEYKDKGSELRIGFDEVYNFFQFMKDVEMFDMAVNATLQMRDNRKLVREDLEHIAAAVSGQKIGPHLAGVIFTMFDLDREDNAVGVANFIQVARNARTHGVVVDNGSAQRGAMSLGQSLVSMLVGTDTDGDGRMDWGEKRTGTARR